MPAPSNKKKPAKKATTLKPVATATPATVQSSPTPPTSTSQPPVLSTTAATEPKPLPTNNTISFALFVSQADLADIDRFFKVAGSSQETLNLKLFWGRAFAEGKKVGREEQYN